MGLGGLVAVASFGPFFGRRGAEATVVKTIHYCIISGSTLQNKVP